MLDKNKKIKIKKSDIKRMAEKLISKKNKVLDEIIDSENNFISGDEPHIPDNTYSTSPQTTDDNVKSSQQPIDFSRLYGYFLYEYDALLSNEEYGVIDITENERYLKIYNFLKSQNKEVILSFVLALIDELSLKNSYKIKNVIINKLKAGDGIVDEEIIKRKK